MYYAAVVVHTSMFAPAGGKAPVAGYGERSGLQHDHRRYADSGSSTGATAGAISGREVGVDRGATDEGRGENQEAHREETRENLQEAHRSWSEHVTDPHVHGYRLMKLIGQGSFGKVYLCRSEQSGHEACVKLESVNVLPPQVFYEHRLYESLSKTGASAFVPRSLAYGENKHFRYLVLTLGGPDLTHITCTYSIVEKLLVFANIIRALRSFHDAGVVHRDIKPRNILIKRGASKTDVLLIDLGLAKRYSLHGVHAENRQKKTAVGTSRYASVHAQMFMESARRDDLLSCAYTMVSVFGRSLPWEGLRGTNQLKAQETLRLKRMLSPGRVCAGCPTCVERIYRHVQQLAYAEEPPYDLFLSLIDHHLPSGRSLGKALQR